MRTYGVNQVFRFVEGNLLHRKSRQIFGNDPFYSTRAHHVWATILYKYHGIWCKHNRHKKKSEKDTSEKYNTSSWTVLSLKCYRKKSPYICIKYTKKDRDRDRTQRQRQRQKERRRHREREKGTRDREIKIEQEREIERERDQSTASLFFYICIL